MNIQQLHIIQFLVFLYGAILSIFLHVNKNADLKRKVFPYLLGILGILMFAIIWSDPKTDMSAIYIVVAVSLIMILNYRTINFCTSCGKTVFSRNPVKPQSYCGNCGNKVTAEKGEKDKT